MSAPARQERPRTGAVETLRDAAHEFRLQAERVGARTFHLYDLGHAGSGRCLVPRLDTAYPARSPETLSLAECLPSRFADAVTTRACPVWWGKRPPEALSGGWSEHMDVAHSRSGLALPLRADQGRFAVVIFVDCDPGFDSDTLMDTHGACHRLFRSLSDSLHADSEPSMPVISPRELQCLQLTAKGLTSQEIAEELGLSVHTTNQYLANTARKLNAVNRVHALAKALRSGLIE